MLLLILIVPEFSRIIQSHLFSLCFCNWATHRRDPLQHCVRCVILGLNGAFPCPPYLIITNQWLGLSNGFWSRQRGHKWHWIPTAHNYFHAALRSHVGANGRCFIPQCSGEHPPPSSSQWDMYTDHGPHIKVAVLFNPFVALVLSTFCGVTIPYPTMMKFWRSWLYQLNPYTRTLAAMVSTELQ